MVNIVVVPDPIFQMDIVVNGCKNIFLGNMLGNQLMDILPDRLCKLLRTVSELLNNLSKNRIIHLLRDSELSGIAVHKTGNVHHHIGKNLYVFLLCLHIDIRNRGILNLVSKLGSHLRTCRCQNFAGCGIHHILRQDMIPDPVAKRQLLIIFISSDLSQIISSGIKKHSVNQAFRTFNAQRLSGTDLFV